MGVTFAVAKVSVKNVQRNQCAKRTVNMDTIITKTDATLASVIGNGSAQSAATSVNLAMSMILTVM